jgi:hypothetical protein
MEDRAMLKAATGPLNFLTTTLGRIGRQVFRLGLSGSYWPGERALRARTISMSFTSSGWATASFRPGRWT